jgi:hypothetical protein
MKRKDLRVGCVVRIARTLVPHILKKGAVGVVRFLDTDGAIGVSFEDLKGRGHNFGKDGKYKGNDGLWVGSGDLDVYMDKTDIIKKIDNVIEKIKKHI